MDTFTEAVQEFDSGNFGRATTLLQEYLASSPGHAHAHRLLAAAYLRLDKVAEAETEAQRFIELRPDDTAGYLQLGRIYIRQNRVGEARSQFERAVQSDPLNSDAKAELQRLSWRAGVQQDGSSQRSASMVPSHRRTWQSNLFKVVAVVATLAIIAAAFFQQWRSSRATEVKDETRTLVADRPPDTTRPNTNATLPQPQAPSASTFNEPIPSTPQPQAPPLQPQATPQMQQQPNSNFQNQGPMQQQGPANQNPNLQGPMTGTGPQGNAGGSRGGMSAWLACPGPHGYLATIESGSTEDLQKALEAAANSLFGMASSNKDVICVNGRYRCLNHKLDADDGTGDKVCRNCGMAEPEGLCPVCHGTGRIRNPLAGLDTGGLTAGR